MRMKVNECVSLPFFRSIAATVEGRTNITKEETNIVAIASTEKRNESDNKNYLIVTILQMLSSASVCMVILISISYLVLIGI